MILQTKDTFVILLKQIWYILVAPDHNAAMQGAASLQKILYSVSNSDFI